MEIMLGSSQSPEKSGASEGKTFGVSGGMVSLNPLRSRGHRKDKGSYLPLTTKSQSPEKSGASEDYPLEDPSVKVRKGLFGARGSKTVN